MRHHDAGHCEGMVTEEIGAPSAGVDEAVGMTCAAWRDALEARTLSRLREPVKTLDTPSLDPANTIITLDLACYDSAEQADDAEGAIDWFSRQDDQMARQRACRTAFAALELQGYLRRIAGVSRGFEIRAAGAPPGAEGVVLHLDAGGGPEDTDGRFEIVVDRGRVRLRGLSIQGCLYAVYDYLEQLGCVFLDPESGSDVLAAGPARMPHATAQVPSFYWRRLHGWRKNRATPGLVSWMGKARINVWGADQRVPGMRKRGILLASGMHDILPVLGLREDFNVLDAGDRRTLREGIVRAFADGPYTDADICEYIGCDWGPRPRVDFDGNMTDLELRAIHEVRDALRQAFADGRINRDVFVSGYAYFDCEDPPRLAMPPGFDGRRIAVEYWSMRCWEHLLGEAACAEDFPLLATMHHYRGQRMLMPSNRLIHDRLVGWSRAAHYTGRLGMGHYFSNAGNFHIPLVLSAVMSYEMPLQHRLGVRQINYMHIAVDDWGPTALTNHLYSRLAWAVTGDAAGMIAGYLRSRFAADAVTMAGIYFDLERAAAPLGVLKRVVVNGLKMRGSLQPVADHAHVRGWQDPGAGLAAAVDRIDGVVERMRRVGGREVERDLRWARYAQQTLRLYQVVIEAASQRDRGRPSACAALLREADHLVEQLRQVDLRLHLPEKIEVDAAEASGLLDILQTLRREMDGAGTGAGDGELPLVQSDIMPVCPCPTDAEQENPELRFPDPSWPKPKPCNELGWVMTPLWHTDIKHYGAVAQSVDGRMRVAVVGEDRRTEPGGHGTLRGASVACLSLESGVLWRHDLRRAGFIVHLGPWPAFVDLTGRGDWAVSVHVIFDGGPGRRMGYIHLYDARTGALRWRCRTQHDREYPGGNGACVAADVDGDGGIELIYGLCNQVLCLRAIDGRVKWSYDDRIRICHGRLAMADVNDDGWPEVIVATEYADDPADPHGDRSSILTLDGTGRLLRRLSNIRGDLGSTPIVVADVDGDGKPEIIHGSENLVYHPPRHMGQLFVLERYLVPKLDPVSTGGARFAVADIDGDGAPEAVGVTSYRDGGPRVRPEVFCVRVRDGRVKWRSPIPRTWLDGDAILVDVDGDGRLEVIVTANYPSGYMHQPGTEPWADLFVLNHLGQVRYQKTLPDAAMSPIATDLDGDGRADLIVPCYDGWIYRIPTPGPARHDGWPLACRDARRTGAYT